MIHTLNEEVKEMDDVKVETGNKKILFSKSEMSGKIDSKDRFAKALFFPMRQCELHLENAVGYQTEAGSR